MTFSFIFEIRGARINAFWFIVYPLSVREEGRYICYTFSYKRQTKHYLIRVRHLGTSDSQPRNL